MGKILPMSYILKIYSFLLETNMEEVEKEIYIYNVFFYDINYGRLFLLVSTVYENVASSFAYKTRSTLKSKKIYGIQFDPSYIIEICVPHVQVKSISLFI